MGIDDFGTEGEKTEENPCRVLKPNQKIWTHLIQSSRSVAYENRENKHREKKDGTNNPLSL